MRRAFAPLTVLALFAPAASVRAANKDIERLQVQVAALQGQMADLQRTAEDSLKEVRRLNELLAEQTAFFRRSVQDQRLQDEALQATLKDLADRLAELGERLQASQAAAAAAVAPAAPLAGSTPVAGGTPAAGGIPGAPGAPPAPGAVPSPAAPGAALPTPAPTAPPPPPRELYSQAYADYARGNYDLAVQGFQEYMRNYPNTDFTDNAQYWIGECLYGKQRYREALEAWDTLFRTFPSSDKLPDAHYKRGLALERLGRRADALAEFRFVRDRYPNSEAGRKAREKLQ
jgi:tol-pal system protein YbgF